MIEKFSARFSSFNLMATYDSGQPLNFIGKYEKGILAYPCCNSIVKVFLHKGFIEAEAEGMKLNAALEVKRRFRLYDNLNKVYENISDPFMDKAIEYSRGMRLTLNDPWETTAIFIISQFNSIHNIKKSVEMIMEKFGRPIYLYGKKIGNAFPESRVIAEASAEELKKASIGFRAKYLHEAANYCTYSFDLYSLQGKDYYSIKEALMDIDGIGDKVADCIALMGYGKLEAFPIDRWIKRILEKAYMHGNPSSISELHRFAERKWGSLQGYAQQYLFRYGIKAFGD
ncbi:MAG: hypothetical protein QXD11_02455 [Candidatus Micrarchaeaceae archaeon]